MDQMSLVDGVLRVCIYRVVHCIALPEVFSHRTLSGLVSQLLVNGEWWPADGEPRPTIMDFRTKFEPGTNGMHT
jgi:hypothetical protein